MVNESINTDEQSEHPRDKRFITRALDVTIPAQTLRLPPRVDTIKSIPVQVTNTQVSGVEGNLVEVVWVDATFSGGTSTGMSREEVSTKRPLRTESWGMCVVDDPEFIAIAQSHNEEGWFEILTIPTGMIESVAVLEGGIDGQSSGGTTPHSFDQHRGVDPTC